MAQEKKASVSNPSSKHSHYSRTTATSGRLVPHEWPGIPGVSLHVWESAALPGWPPSPIYIRVPPAPWVTCGCPISAASWIRISVRNNPLPPWSFSPEKSTEWDSGLGQWRSSPQINGCAWSHGEGDAGGDDKLPSNYTARPFQGRLDPYSPHLWRNQHSFCCAKSGALSEPCCKLSKHRRIRTKTPEHDN